jgi:hypothetical protein
MTQRQFARALVRAAAVLCARGRPSALAPPVRFRRPSSVRACLPAFPPVRGVGAAPRVPVPLGVTN